ncbi:MAG TPA: hypothetical protein P5075_08755 [Eubacteriales bacterium]|nr:hypothetical protein [Eubacteriales bacterium]
MIQEFLTLAKRGQNVFLPDVVKAFSTEKAIVMCALEPSSGGRHVWEIRFPEADGEEETRFIKEYFYARIYNLISAFGGRRMTLYVPSGGDFAAALCRTLDDVFQINLPKKERTGYGKCLNVTDRINAATGEQPFSFQIVEGECPAETPRPQQKADAVSSCKAAVQTACGAALCGIDIGGTDIKVIGILNGRICAVKEYDWNPAEMTNVDALIGPVLLMARIMRTALSLPDTPEAARLKEKMLEKGASDEKMRAAADEALRAYGVPEKLDGIGVCFPDVVIDDMIVGGETYKTRGIRAHSADYEAEFSKLAGLKRMLLSHCREGGRVHMSNDGSLAAYTAAVELAHSERADTVKKGVFAHTLGTELGTGWLDESGEIPQIPLEIYNCVIDLGDYPARAFEPTDARSLLNFNTGLPGTLQKYCSQSGAYRLALRIFEREAPALYQDLFDLGFLERRDGGIHVKTSPADMRKPLLEHLMKLAAGGERAAEKIFREIGGYLAVTFAETERMLRPETKTRVLFGRFVKHKRCFELMQEGASMRQPAEMLAGDGNLAFTPVMLELSRDPEHTVAQFGQAVGAAYFAASVLGRD